MRIPCPYCGDRDSSEFFYRGDATALRPAPDRPQASAEFFKYVYLRDNPAGLLTEHWYHANGCRRWVVVERDTRSHEITRAALAGDFGA
jgi:heterotetrameric sarcosine oxidase delta subunit